MADSPKTIAMPVKFASLLLLLFLVTAAAVACGDDNDNSSDSGDPSGQQTRQPDQAAFTEAEAQLAADAALLVLEDFPVGWTAAPPEEEDDDDFDFSGLPPECSFIDGGGDDGEGDDYVASAASDDFVGLNDEQVSVEIDVHKSTSLAEFSFDTAEAFFEQCQQPMEDAFLAAFEQEFAGQSGEAAFEIAISDFSFGEVSFPEIGDDTLALEMSFKMSASFVEFDFLGHIILVRVDNMGATFSYFSFLGPPDLDLEQDLLTQVASRMDTQAAILAE